MMCSWRWIGWLTLLPICLAACQPRGPEVDATTAEPATAPAPTVTAGATARVNWSNVGDCRDMVTTLKRGWEDGWINELDETPFLLINDQLSNAGGLRPTYAWDVKLEGSPSSTMAEARCVLRVGPPGERRSEHRVLGREQVRSRYQSGTRSKKNPAYEVAKTRLRLAEKAAKPGKSSIVKVGDPLVDLLGTLVGGALTGFGQWGAGDQLEEALDTLMATPPSIDHPVYKSYHFERARVRASREAVVPVILTDRELLRSWQVSLKRRERRDLFVVNGLDRQDEEYTRHSQDSLTESGLQQWLEETPSPSLADIAAGLLDRPSAVPIDRLALAGAETELADADPLITDESMDAAALPATSMSGTKHHVIDRSPPVGTVSASQIKIIGEADEAEGVFVAPHFILTPSEVIGKRGLVDIEDSSGHVALGLVVAVDHGLGLALIQAPLAGQPITIARGGLGNAGPVGVLFARGSGPMPASSLKGAISAPILVDGELAGFRTKSGPDIEADAIEIFLDRQQHLLPVGRLASGVTTSSGPRRNRKTH